MFQAMILIGGILAFIVGSLIFLIGIGAIVGCAGGIIILFCGVALSVAGIGTVVNYILMDPLHREMNISDLVDLIKKNEQWASV